MTDAIDTSGLNDSTPEDDGPEIGLCTKCLAELPPMADFCPQCRGPVTSHANSGYYESALSQGWSMGEAVVTKSPRLVTLIGLWILFFPLVCLGAWLLFQSHGRGWTDGTAIGTVAVTGLCALYGWCLYRGTRNYIRARRRPAVDEPQESDVDPGATGA